MARKTFKETQRFNQIWIWIILIPISLYLIYLVVDSLYTQFYLHQPWGDKPMTDNMLLLFAAFMLLMSIGLPWSIASLQLLTSIDEKGVSYKFKPLHRKYRTLLWVDIAKIFVRKYRPILEYGGWGIRFGRNGRAYNTSGNEGIQLLLTNKKKILIGTHKSREAKEVLEYYFPADKKADR